MNAVVTETCDATCRFGTAEILPVIFDIPRLFTKNLAAVLIYLS